MRVYAARHHPCIKTQNYVLSCIGSVIELEWPCLPSGKYDTKVCISVSVYYVCQLFKQRSSWRSINMINLLSTGHLPTLSLKLLKECVLTSSSLAFISRAKSTRAHRWAWLSSASWNIYSLIHKCYCKIRLLIRTIISSVFVLLYYHCIFYK